MERNDEKSINSCLFYIFHFTILYWMYYGRSTCKWRISASLLQEEHGDHGHVDPHIWLSPVMAQNIVSNIADGLATRSPAHADQYLTRADHLIQELKGIDAEFRTLLSQKEVDTDRYSCFKKSLYSYSRSFGKSEGSTCYCKGDIRRGCGY